LKRLTHTGSTLRARSIPDKGAIARAVEEHVLPLIAAGRVGPLIDSTFPLAQAAAAPACMETSAHAGKILPTPATPPNSYALSSSAAGAGGGEAALRHPGGGGGPRKGGKAPKSPARRGRWGIGVGRAGGGGGGKGGGRGLFLVRGCERALLPMLGAAPPPAR